MKIHKRVILKYKKYLITGCLILLFLLGIVVGFVPGFKNLYTRYESLEKKSKEAKILVQKATLLESLDEVGLDNSVTVLTSALPFQSNYSTLLTLIETLAQQEKLTISSFSVSGGSISASGSASKQSKIDAKIGAHQVPFEFSIIGPLDQIRNMMNTSKTVRRLIRFDNLTVGLTSRLASQSGDLTTSITGTAFYLPEPKALGSISEPLVDFSQAEKDVISTMALYPDFSYGTLHTNTIEPFFDQNRSDPFIP